MTDWDDAYANMAHIPGSANLPAQWSADARAYRESGVRIDEDIAYGSAPREKLDLVWPDGAAKGLAVFVHGGYWMRMSKSDWTHYAEGARAIGWAVALPSYTLAPEARLAQMTEQTAAAIIKAAEMVSGPIRLSGHSAGGHLVSRMLCSPALLPTEVIKRIEHVVSISGLHDLRPLMKTEMNETLQIDIAEAHAESAALSDPIPNTRITAWVGGNERPEFIRQSELLANVWTGLDVETACVIDSDHHHFSVIEALRSPTSALCKAWLT